MRSFAPVPVGVFVLAAAVLADGGAFDRALAKDKQAAHVLNRLTYGPLPGEIEELRRTGVTKWLQRQLHPEDIPLGEALQAKLQPLESLTLQTWQAFERYQPVTVVRPGITQFVQGEQLTKLLNGTNEERRAILTALTAEQRMMVLPTIPQQVIAGLPELQEEANKARAADQLLRQAEQRRLRPPLADLLTTEQQQIVQRGTQDERIALLQSLDREKRVHVLRQVPQAQVPDIFQRDALVARQPQQAVVAETIEAKLLRARYSPRQLEEVLVDFWVNHFNVTIDKGNIRMMVASYERDAIRPHVFGRFRSMLLATARHPAMQFYLDNWQSRAAPDPERVTGQKPALNENYGRELLELHTLGVDGGYTQDDVIAVARCFTGWTIFDPARYGEFQFNPANHDRGEKKVLGQTIPRGGGEDDGVKVIDILARHPSTARFISRKLAQRFVADDPPQTLVNRMAETFTRTDGDLRAVMETLLTSREFLSEGAWQAKMKSPLEFVVSALRALDATVTDTTILAQRLTTLGQPMYAKQEPTGYPNTGEGWSSSAAILARIDFATAMVSGQLKGVQVDTTAWAAPGLRRVFTDTIGVEPSAARMDALERAVGEKELSSVDLATVVLASPDFQKR